MSSASRLSENFAKGDLVAQFMPIDAAAPPSPADVSVGGVLLLTTMAVILAILGAMLLASIVLGTWWLAVHIPVPPAVMRLLAASHL